ncbi:MAG: sodium/glutamate symporter [Treponema sp.]
MDITMNMYQSLGFAVVWLLIGRYLKDHVKFFQKYCIPAPIIGGFLFAIISLIGHNTGVLNFKFDKTLQEYWMVMFFTTVGYNAGFSVLKKGGVKVFIFLVATILLAVLQHVVAQSVAHLIHFSPKLAVMLGSTSFTGGFGTAAAFAPLVDPDGTLGALTLAVAVPTFSSIISSIMGGPVGNNLISKYNLSPTHSNIQVKVDEKGSIIKQTTEVTTVPVVDSRPFFKKLFSRAKKTEEIVKVHEEVIHTKATRLEADNTKPSLEQTLNSEKIASSFMVLVVAVGIGIFITNHLNNISTRAQFPIYIGAMLVAAVLRNIADTTNLFKVEMEAMDTLGSVALNLFLAMALVSLELWKLVDLAVPLFIILGAQIVLMYVFAKFITFNVMGRDYDAAVITAGHIGFGFAATPNAMANMGSVCEKYGYSEIAFFVVPIVGSLFIDLFNVMIISGTLALVQ